MLRTCLGESHRIWSCRGEELGCIQKSPPSTVHSEKQEIKQRHQEAHMDDQRVPN